MLINWPSVKMSQIKQRRRHVVQLSIAGAKQDRAAVFVEFQRGRMWAGYDRHSDPAGKRGREFGEQIAAGDSFERFAEEDSICDNRGPKRGAKLTCAAGGESRGEQVVCMFFGCFV